ncbi:MAG: hypothetical protein ACREFP_27335 [Acetobacteraceae bacterium]
MNSLAITVASVSIGIGMAGAMAETPQPTTVFKGVVAAAPTTGPAQSGQVSVQTWELGGPKGAAHEIPLRGFYVAHLLSGAIATTIDGQTTNQPPGAYWTVKAGATMQVKVLGEFAVIETIVVTR